MSDEDGDRRHLLVYPSFVFSLSLSLHLHSLEHFSAHFEDQHSVERVEPRHFLKALAQQRDELLELDVEVRLELGALF